VGVYAQDSEPAGGNIGDIWIDTDSGQNTIGAVPRFEAIRTTDQNVTDGSTQKAQWPTIEENVGGFTYSGGDVTVPLTGRYSITAQINWAQNGTNRRIVLIEVDGSTYFSNYAETTSEAGGFRQFISVPSLRVTAGQEVTISIRQDAGTTTAFNNGRLIIEYLGA
jgi:hypothetical protein